METRAKRGLGGGFEVWVPIVEMLSQVTVEGLGAGLQQEVSAARRPAHLLFFDHAL